MNLFELWFPENPSYDRQLAVYESLLKNFENDGFKESYEILDIQYRHFKYQHRNGIYKWIVDPYQSWWWNYGYSQWKVFLWTFCLWALFTLFNLRWYPKLSEEVYAVNFLERLTYPTDWVRKVKNFIRVATYTGIVFFGLKMDIAKFKKGAIKRHPWLFIYLMVIYASGLWCLGYIVNIVFTT